MAEPWWGDAVQDALGAIDATDDARVVADEDSGVAALRAFAGSDAWKDFAAFCNRVLKGEAKPSCVIDFAFGDIGKHPKNLNLEGDKRFLERMYCFHDPKKGSPKAFLVVVHVHTLVPWGDRRKLLAGQKLTRITSVNVRHAFKKYPFRRSDKFNQETGKFKVVPAPWNKAINDDWQKLWRQGKKEELEWCPSREGSTPVLDKDAGWRYKVVRSVILAGETLCKESVVTSGIKETETTMRGGHVVDYEVVGVSEEKPSFVVPEHSNLPSESGIVHSVVPAAFPSSRPSDAPSQPGVLFLGINVSGQPELGVHTEFDGMRDALRRGLGPRWRERVVIDNDYFSEPDKLVKCLREWRPSALQIACHGEVDGLLFKESFVDSGRLTEAIQAANRGAQAGGKPQVRLVVINACLSGEVAWMLARSVEFVIGHRDKLPDKDAIGFAETFYAELAIGNSLLQSFHAARMPQGRSSYELVARSSDPDAMVLFPHVEPTDSTTPSSVKSRGSKVNLWNVRPDDFEHVRRHAQMLVLQAWLDSRRSRISIYGLGGSGKSTLAKQFLMEAHARAEYDVVAFLRADRLQDDYVELAIKLLGSSQTEKRQSLRSMTATDLRDHVHNLLACGGTKWLIVIDDLPQGDPLDCDEQMLRGYPWSDGKTIVTSRSQEWDLDGRGLYVGAYDEEEAINFCISKIAEWGDKLHDVRLLVKRLGCFPLAVRQAVHYCKDLRLKGPLQYLEQMGSKTEQQWTERQREQYDEDMADRDETDKYPFWFVEVVHLSISRLIDSEEESMQQALKLLRMLSYLHSAEIPLEIFSADLRSSLGLLKSQSLVVDVEGVDEAVSMHPLTQEVVRRHLMGSSRPEVIGSLVEALLHMVGQIDRSQKQTFAIGWRLMAHVEKLIRLLKREWERSGTPSAPRIIMKDLASLCDSMGLFLTDVACLFGKASRCYQAALAIKLKFFGHKSASIASTYSKMGTVCLRQHKYEESLECYKRCLSMRTEAHGGVEHPSVAVTYSNMGNVFCAQGLYDEAQRHHEKCLKIQIKLLGSNHPSVAATYHNIGLTLMSKGQYDGAVEHYRKCLNIRLQEESCKPVAIASAYNNLALAFESQGLYDETLELYNKSLDITLNELGEDHVRVGATYSNMGNLFRLQGLFDKALEYYQRSVNILAALEGAQADLAGSFGNMGTVCEAQGLYDCAMEYHNQCLDILLKVHRGEHHVTVAMAYGNLGTVLCKKSLHSKALEYHDKCLDIQLKILDGDHVSVATTHENIGTVLSLQGKHNEALASYRKSLAIQLQVLGEEHADVGSTYGNIGSVLWRKGLYAKALEHFEKCQEILVKVLGEQHIKVAEARGSMGDTFWQLGQFDKAMECHQMCLNVQLEVHGDRHPGVASTCSNVGRVLWSQCLYQQALTHHQRCLEIELEVLGREHGDVAGTYNGLGEALWALGRYDEALEAHEASLDIALKVHGSNHERVAEAYSRMGRVLLSRGLGEKALGLQQKSLDIRVKALGEDHVEVAETYGDISRALLLQGLAENALEYAEKCLGIQLRALGGLHFEVGRSYCIMGNVLWSQGKLDEAQSCNKKGLDVLVAALGDSHVDVAAAYGNLSRVFQSRMLYDQALTYQRMCLEIRLGALGKEHPDVEEILREIDCSLAGQRVQHLGLLACLCVCAVQLVFAWRIRKL